MSIATAAWVQVGGPALRASDRTRNDRRCHYDLVLKRKAGVLIEQGYGRKRLARELGIPVSTAREWVLRYRSGGHANLCSETTPYRRFSLPVKRAAVYEHVVQGVTLSDLMAKYGVNDLSTIKKWCRALGEDVVQNGV